MLRALLAALISGEAKAFAGRARTAAALYLLASVALAAGIAFLVGAAFLLAAERFGSLRAAIGFGLGLVGLLLPVVGLVALKILDENRQTDGGRDDEPS
jgi:hypothetical protein